MNSCFDAKYWVQLTDFNCATTLPFQKWKMPHNEIWMLYKANLFLIHTLMFMQFILCFSLVVSSLTFENTTLFHSTLILIKHVKYYSIQQKSCVLVLSSSSVCIQKLYNTMLYNTIYYYYFVPSVLISQLFSSTQCLVTICTNVYIVCPLHIQ